MHFGTISMELSILYFEGLPFKRSLNSVSIALNIVMTHLSHWLMVNYCDIIGCPSSPR